MKDRSVNLFQSSYYTAEFDMALGRLLLSTPSGVLLDLPLTIHLQMWEPGIPLQDGVCRTSETLEAVTPTASTTPRIPGTQEYCLTVRPMGSGEPSGTKRYHLIFAEDWYELYCTIEGGEGGNIDRIRFFAQENGAAKPSGIARYYVPRFDWSLGKVHRAPQETDSISCHQWLSPGPFFYGIEQQAQWFGMGIGAAVGTCDFLSMDWSVDERMDGFALDLNYEGHGILGTEVFESPHLIFTLRPETDENDALRQYIGRLIDAGLIAHTPRDIPAWWREPIFCGWGQQRFDFRLDHDGHENGNWINAGDYATEVFYRRQMDLFESKGIDPGIVIIDCFWAKTPIMAAPHPLKWQDMRTFIDEQHARGRKVLLWFTPILFDGLPIEACITLEGRPIAGDPSSPVYRDILAREIEHMLSDAPGCLNADGFKIDFTQNISSERGRFRDILKDRWAIISEEEPKMYPSLDSRTELIQTTEPIWGLELIRAYLQAIREPMKRIKQDSLLITHTANPYLADEVDMLRLNDMDGLSPDVLGIMKNRAEIALSCNPNWLIDTDNDLMTCKAMWREYIQLQLQLGNPDTYYASGIAQSHESFDDDDYALLRSVFAEYRKKLGERIYGGREITS